MKTHLKIACTIILSILIGGNYATSATFAQMLPDMLTGTTQIVSVTSSGAQGNVGSISPSISADGRYVVFQSEAINLVPNDTNAVGDIFLHDRETGETRRVSISSTGQQADDYSNDPSISADGNFIVFESHADNLVPGDTNTHTDIFIHNPVTGETTRISIGADGTQADGPSYEPAISQDGRYVVFVSVATNLVPGDENGFGDIFVHDRQTSVTTLVSLATNGTRANNFSEMPSISSTGRFVTFSSFADNLVSGDTNLCWWINQYIDCPDIFIHDTSTGDTARVSVASNGTQGDDFSWGSSQISADGRYVFFESWSTNLVEGDTNEATDIFLHDWVTGETRRVSVAADGTQGDAGGWSPSLSFDGNSLAFASGSSNLVEGDTNSASDIFVRNLSTGEVSLTSLNFYGEQAYLSSYNPSISSDGQNVAFSSEAFNLVVGDANNSQDIFLRDRQGEVITYTVSGNITDLDGNPLQGVTVINNNGPSVMTDEQGNYLFTGLDSGIYRIMPSLDDLFFSPGWHTISVPPGRVGVDFHQVIPTYIHLPIIIR